MNLLGLLTNECCAALEDGLGEVDAGAAFVESGLDGAHLGDGLIYKFGRLELLRDIWI